MSRLEEKYRLLGKYIDLTHINEKKNQYDSSTKALLGKVKTLKTKMDDEEDKRITLSRAIKFLMKKYQDYGDEAAATYKEFTGKDPKKILNLRKRHAALKKKQKEFMSKVKGKRSELNKVNDGIKDSQSKMRKLKDSIRSNKKLITKAARIAARKGRL